MCYYLPPEFLQSIGKLGGGGADGKNFSCFLFHVSSLFLFLSGMGGLDWAGLGLVGGESLLLQWISAYHLFLQGVSLNICQALVNRAHIPVLCTHSFKIPQSQQPGIRWAPLSSSVGASVRAHVLRASNRQSKQSFHRRSDAGMATPRPIGYKRFLGGRRKGEPY